MSSGINLDSFFSKQIVDSNGVNCCDINEGLHELFELVNEEKYSLGEVQRYLVSEFEDGYPDLVAKNSVLGSQDYWWWILLLNGLEDSFVDIKENWVYSINSKEQIEELISKANKKNILKKSKVGTVVELN